METFVKDKKYIRNTNYLFSTNTDHDQVAKLKFDAYTSDNIGGKSLFSP